MRRPRKQPIPKPPADPAILALARALARQAARDDHAQHERCPDGATRNPG